MIAGGLLFVDPHRAAATFCNINNNAKVRSVKPDSPAPLDRIKCIGPLSTKNPSKKQTGRDISVANKG
jgi:hypothetical protein